MDENDEGSMVSEGWQSGAVQAVSGVDKDLTAKRRPPKELWTHDGRGTESVGLNTMWVRSSQTNWIGFRQKV